MSDQVTELLMRNVSTVLFRVIWKNHIDPSQRSSYADDFVDGLCDGIVRTFEQHSGIGAPGGDRVMARALVRILISTAFGDIRKVVPPFTDDSFEKLAENIVGARGESKLNEMFAAQFDAWTSRIASLDSSLISSLDKISEEYLIWLKSHPDDLDKVHWAAFERLTGEILASHGFAVGFTGQVKDQSADLIAAETNSLGITTKYLIECKRYNRTKKVDISIVNAVLGSMQRANVDHAILVTTSSFTRNVTSKTSSLADLRLHLRDGAQVKEWLGGYELKNNGLWLTDDWQVT